jgi:hypothetical protein
MEFRVPKPLHGWREFAGEVGIIVIGVLIALGAEQVVEDWRWHRQVEASRLAFKDELLSSAQWACERMAIQPCLQGQLRAFSAQLVKGGGNWHALPAPLKEPRRYYQSVTPVVYRPPNRPIYEDAWRNALADGTINHFDKDEAETLSSAYGSVAQIKELQADEGRAESKISPLGYDLPLSQEQRVQMLQAIAELDWLNDLLVVNGRDLFTSLRKVDLGITTADTDQIRKDVIEVQTNYRGTCVRTDLPLDLR